MTEELVTVGVMTFNSAKTVVETLKSVLIQTYPRIELIVSDDGSEDDTVAICRQWLMQHENRFFRSEILTVPANTGVSANCNRCIGASRSDWIKFIAGDDILLPNCLSDNMDYVSNNKEAKIVFSYVRLYRNTFDELNYLAQVPSATPVAFMEPSVTANAQFKQLLLSDRIPFTPSYFFNKGTILSVGGYDEKQKRVEDYPMWLKLTESGVKLHFMEKVTVGYRRHDKALNNFEHRALFKPVLLQMHLFRKEYVFPHLAWYVVWMEKHTIVISKIFYFLNLNHDRPLQRRLYRLLTVYCNPFLYARFFAKRVLHRDEYASKI